MLATFVVPFWFGVSSLVLVVILASAKGGTEARAAALGLFLSWIATIAMRDRSWPLMQWGSVIADGAFLIFVLRLSLRSPRYWPLFVAAFGLLAVLTDLAPLMDQTLHPWILITGSIVWTWCIMIAIAWASIANWRREASMQQEIALRWRRRTLGGG